MDEADDYIAIVGIGCNFPGGEGLDNFWKVLVEGRNCTVEIPAERFNTKYWCDPDYNKAGKICTSRAALIEGFNEFDNKLFGISNAETEKMDPQQKLLLECTYRALEDAGLPLEHISGSKTGVFIGLMNRDAESLFSNSADSINHFTGAGTASSIAANRISYCFNLTGPSLTIDTACSSSLVALHYACQAIKQGDCEMAVCGGVSCIIEPRIYVALSKANMISPDGISKPFSKQANGYGRGEGCGVVLLKPLKKAKEDHSKVWGVICASAVNQDGRSVTPITKPSQSQQEDLLRSIYSRISPSAVQYIEAHGTGTPAGDPIEATSIGNIIGKKHSNGSQALLIGSVKGNIGHSEAAAGMAGLIKVLLMMHHEMIPPSLHYSKESSIINMEELNLVIPTSPTRWKDPGSVGRTAGINSFGFGGTNVHVVVKQHKPTTSQCFLKRPTEIFILSAPSSKSLQLTIENMKETLNTTATLSLQNLVYTSACRRSHINYKYRKAFLASSILDLQQQLESVNTETSPSKGPPQIVFVFCGNGVNYKGMCKMLLRCEPVFRHKCIEIDELLQIFTHISVLDLLENEFDDFSRPEIAQPLLFTIQVSLVTLLNHWGVKPDSIVGHSVGEVAAAHCSGLLSLQDAVKVIYHRSIQQSKVTGGKMLVVSNIDVTELSKVTDTYSGRLCIAAYNSPTSCTISGDANSVECLHNQLTQQYSKRNVFQHVLDVPAAYHSHLMDPILEEVRVSLQDLKKQHLETEIISTVTGNRLSEDDFTTGEYWARNIREPVAFEKAVRNSATAKENPIFIEIGPRRALHRNIVEILGPNNIILPTVQPSKEHETIFAILNVLFKEGYNPNWGNVYGAYQSVPAVIPSYQFVHIKQAISFEKIRQGNQTVPTTSHPLLQITSDDFTEFKCTISEHVTPYVYEHKHNGCVLVPGTFYVELGMAAAMISLKPKMPLSSLEISVTFSSPCAVNQQYLDLKIKLQKENNVMNFEVLTSHIFSTGQIRKNEDLDEEKRIYLQPIFQRCKLIFKKENIYETIQESGFQHGSVYKQLCDIHYGVVLNEAIANVIVSNKIKEKMHEYYIHPVILDSFFQMLVVFGTGPNESAAIFPSSIGSITVSKPLQEEMFIYVKKIRTLENEIEVCGCFVNANGIILAELKNVKITFVKKTLKQKNVFFQNAWKKAPMLENMNKSEHESNMLVFADTSGVAQQLQKYIHSRLIYIMHNNWDSETQLMKILNNTCQDVLFLWGIERFREEFPHNLTQYIAMCCETYRQVIMEVSKHSSSPCIRTVTFRTREHTVDHINIGFALIGMTRACITEMADIKFQLIDINSLANENIEALARVILNYKSDDYPEIWINEGNIYTSEVSTKKIEFVERRKDIVQLQTSDYFTLHTTDPYRVTELSAEISNSEITELANKTVEVQIDQICCHTDDYFPVTVSSCQFGRTLYWNNFVTEKHKLIALDFSGTVTAVGKNVRNLNIGDRVASCYPTVASSRVNLPEIVCFSDADVPFLQNVPCISQFILAWHILHHQLPHGKNKPKLTILTSEALSVFSNILIETARERGWEPTISSYSDTDAKQCSAMIILPTSEVISVEELSKLTQLKDLVIICDRRNHQHSQNLIENCREDIHVHILQISTIFQKPYLKKFAKHIYKWLKSMQACMFLRVPNSTSLLSVRTNCIHVPEPSYFQVQSLPVIELDKNRVSDLPLSVTEKSLFKRDAVYIVTGGLTGLGFETVKFITQNCGGHIVILSRRNPTPEMEQQIKTIKNNMPVRIIALQCDIIQYCEVVKAMESIQKIFSNIPIKGVFHSAAVFHDGILQHLSISLFEKVLSPKVEGTVNLHRATLNHELDYFVCFSSIASFIGNTGQANYAAANSFLDMFCQYRRNMGLPAQSINWGALNLGVLLHQDNIQRLLKAKGILLFNTEEIHKYLQECLMLNNCQQAIVKFDFKALHHNLISHIPALKQRLYNVVAEEFSNLVDTTTLNVSSKPSKIKQEDYVKSLVSELTSANLSDIKMSTSLNSLGIDSMLAMTLQNQIFQEKNVNIPLVKLLDPSTTVSVLVSMFTKNSADADRIL
ncbi:mycocerosic acid synthase-like [Rhinophrynus dorsalis]